MQKYARLRASIPSIWIYKDGLSLASGISTSRNGEEGGNIRQVSFLHVRTISNLKYACTELRLAFVVCALILLSVPNAKGDDDCPPPPYA